MESINNRVDSIYKQLCECEELITAQNKDDAGGNADNKIMDLLETLETIQEAAQLIRPYNWNLKTCHQDLEMQISSLERTMELMDLEMEMGTTNKRTNN